MHPVIPMTRSGLLRRCISSWLVRPITRSSAFSRIAQVFVLIFKHKVDPAEGKRQGRLQKPVAPKLLLVVFAKLTIRLAVVTRPNREEEPILAETQAGIGFHISELLRTDTGLFVPGGQISSQSKVGHPATEVPAQLCPQFDIVQVASTLAVGDPAPGVRHAGVQREEVGKGVLSESVQALPALKEFVSAELVVGETQAHTTARRHVFYEEELWPGRWRCLKSAGRSESDRKNQSGDLHSSAHLIQRSWVIRFSMPA